MNNHKNSYHPLFIVLFVLDLLPHEVIQQIPKSTRNDWDKRKLEQAFGYQFCTLYMKHFNDVAYAYKYSFTRYTLAIAIGIKKTMVAITGNHTLYKKLMRSQANGIIEHINTLAHKGFSVAKACKLFGLKTSWYNYHKRKINCPLNALKHCFKQHPLQLTFTEQNTIKQWIHQLQNAGKTLTHLYYEALNKNIVFCAKTTFFMYAKLLGYKRAFRKPKAKRKKGHRANAIFAC